MSSQNISKQEAIPLALLSALDESEVQGTTRLQKLVFLAQQGGLEGDPIPDEEFESEEFEFKPFDYGPFSKELARTLDRLEDQGLVESETARTNSGNSRKDYQITQPGEEVLGDVDLSEEDEKLLKGVKLLYNDTPLLKLLSDLYDDHEEYAKNTELELGSL